jgi:hypothetical protein
MEWVSGRCHQNAILSLFCLVLATFAYQPLSAASIRVLDIQDSAGEPGDSMMISIEMSNAYGLRMLGFSLFYDSQIMKNVRIGRGDDTLGFESWEYLEVGQNEIVVTGQSTDFPVVRDEAEVALVRFDVSHLATPGQTVTLILDNASGSLDGDIHSDTGVFTVGSNPVEETCRLLELEFEPVEALPGDLVHLRLWLSDTPLLSHLQVYLDFPEGALAQEGAITGALVERSAWAAYYTPPQPGAGHSILVTTFGAPAPRPAPSGRFLAAEVPFRVGPDWGNSWKEFQVTIPDSICLGDVSEHNRYYYVETADAMLHRGPPDFDGDGQLTPVDLFEFMKAWRGSLQSP